MPVGPLGLAVCRCGCYTISKDEVYMKKLIIAVIAALGMKTAVYAADFNLNNLNMADLRASQNEAALMNIPTPEEIAGIEKSPNIPTSALDMTIKLPFAVLSKRIATMPLVTITPLDASAPILFKEGDHISLSNINVKYNDIDVQPTIRIRPSFEGNNKLALKVVGLDADVSFGPKAVLDKDGLMEMVMTQLTTGMLSAMDTALAGNKVALRARDILTFSYDRKSWTLRANIVPKFVAPLLPGLIPDLNLTGFTFDNEGFALSVNAGSAVSIARLPGYNLAMSDGLITNFLMQFTAGSNFNLKPGGSYDGGVKFRADGRMEVAGKVYLPDMTFKPNVYFTAIMQPIVTRDNTIWLRVERVNVEKAYGIGVPGFLNNWLQGTIISNVVKTVMTNEALLKVMSAKKLDDKTVELTLKTSAFLPSFANGATIKYMKFGDGLMYLGFAL